MTSSSGSGTNEIVEKFKGLSRGSQVIVAAAVVLFIDGFLHWYSVSASFGGFTVSASANAWDAPGAIWSIFAILLALAMAGVIVARLFLAAGTIPDNISGFSWGKINLGVAGVIALFIIIKLLNHSGDIAYGFFIGILCVIAICAGAFLNFQEEQKGTAA